MKKKFIKNLAKFLDLLRKKRVSAFPYFYLSHTTAVPKHKRDTKIRILENMAIVGSSSCLFVCLFVCYFVRF